MGLNFSSYELSRRALVANQLGMAVTGQNIANVNTPGYTRQKVALASTETRLIGTQMTAAGVSVEGFISFRDRFVESRLQRETAIAGRWEAQRDALSPVDAVFNEAEGGGISSAMNSFFGSFRDLEAYPSSVPLRAVAVEKGNLLVTAFHATAARLQDIRTDVDTRTRIMANDVNSLTSQIAALNQNIREGEYKGETTSELRDKRAETMRQLSELTGAYGVEADDHTLTVTIGDGRALVLGTKAETIDPVPQPPSGLVTLMLNGTPAVFSSGKLRGLIDARGQIESRMTELDELAQGIAERVNTLHTAGTDLDGNPGTPFFAVPDNGQPVTAGSISVSSALRVNPRLVVTSQLAQPASAASTAGAIANLLTDTSSTVGSQTGSFSSIYARIVSNAGAGVKSADDAYQTQQFMLTQTTAQRDAVSGVSLDEEAINLLQYQRAYEAAARFLKVADEMTQMILALGQ
jgi:flagellar hook-associated protein 1